MFLGERLGLSDASESSRLQFRACWESFSIEALNLQGLRIENSGHQTNLHAKTRPATLVGGARARRQVVTAVPEAASQMQIRLRSWLCETGRVETPIELS